MSSTTAIIRGKKAALAPPGRRIHPDAEDGFVPVAVSSCSTCCLGEDEAAVQAASDDKYRKRFNQRQQRFREVMFFMGVALCILIFTVYKISGHTGVRLARPGERPHHYNQNHDRGHLEMNDDHNKDDLYEKRRRRAGRGPGRGSRGRNRRGDSGEDDKKMFERLDAYDKTRGRKWSEAIWGNGKEDADEEDADHKETMIMRESQLEDLNERMLSNTNTSIRWADMSDVPPLPGRNGDSRNNLVWVLGKNQKPQSHRRVNRKGHMRKFFQIHRSERTPMAWEEEFDAIIDKDPTARPNYVNYVNHNYQYPEKLMEPPELGKYPKMRTYKELQETWPQDNLDNPPDVLQEDLIHFDFHDPEDMAAAKKFRDAKLPFKVVNVPEVLEAGKKWTDEYIALNFDTPSGNGPQSNGKCNEGPDNYFAFFNAELWSVEELGIPPTRDNDFTFERWAKHSRYADRVGLHPNLPHFYWQSGVPKEERHMDKSHWTFVSRDLPSFSATVDTFFQFHPNLQKGIQCRFGERGITAANHYDSGRNMIAMITGAKRYILSPPRACKQLGVVSTKGHASFRHSMLNYGRIAMMDREDMPQEEKEWLEIVGTAEAVSTVLKEGEVLYVPTGWFHYITSLQKSAQCNVRSGPDMKGDSYWGGAEEIQGKCFPQA